MAEGISVELLTRQGCGLCAKVRVLLDDAARRQPIRIVEVDIDGDPALRAVYDQRIPVVRVDGTDVCEGVIRGDELRVALARLVGR